jgi:hypothetical protein
MALDFFTASSLWARAEPLPHLHCPGVVFPDRFSVASSDQVGRHRHVGPVDLADSKGFHEEPTDEAFQLARYPNQHMGVCCISLTSVALSTGQDEVCALPKALVTLKKKRR